MTREELEAERDRLLALLELNDDDDAALARYAEVVDALNALVMQEIAAMHIAEPDLIGPCDNCGVPMWATKDDWEDKAVRFTHPGDFDDLNGLCDSCGMHGIADGYVDLSPDWQDDLGCDA